MDSCLRGLADYFLAQKNASTVDPTEIDPQLLPHIFIIDVERDINVRLRIRLVGTALDSMFKQPLVGHLLEEFVHGPRGREVIISFLHCASETLDVRIMEYIQK